MEKIKEKLLPLVSILATLSLFVFVFRLYFSQDDFFHLWVSRTDGSLLDFAKLFSFQSFTERGGIYFYRPIFREALFNIYYQVFGLTAVPFRLTQLVIHSINICLVYVFFKRLTKDITISFFGSLFVAISAANVGVLTYLAGGIQASGMTMFALLTLLFFEGRRTLLAFIAFVLALGSHELALAIPLIIVGLCFVKSKMYKRTIPFFVLSLVLVILEYKFIGFPTGETQYGLSLSPFKVANAYVWYSAWAFGIPEMLLDFVGPGINVNPNLMLFWGNYFGVILPTFFVTILVSLFAFKKLILKKEFYFFVLWFLVALAPVVLLPLHRSTYYLALALPGMAGIFGLVCKRIAKYPFLLASFLITFMVLNFISISLYKKTYWAIGRSTIAEVVLEGLTTAYPVLPESAQIYITNDLTYPSLGSQWGGTSKQASVALSGSDAIRLFYNDDTLKVYYEDLGKPPSGKVYIYKAPSVIKF